MLLGLGLLVALAAAGLGLAAGAWLKNYRTLQPLLLVTAVGSFFMAGGFSTVATLPPGVRLFDRFWSPAYAFETLQWAMHAATLPALQASWVGFAVAVAVSLGLGVWALRRAL